jgi:hypothetical protein
LLGLNGAIVLAGQCGPHRGGPDTTGAIVGVYVGSVCSLTTGLIGVWGGISPFSWVLAQEELGFCSHAAQHTKGPKVHMATDNGRESRIAYALWTLDLWGTLNFMPGL